jgi:pimeloyl-ACP methyl ester carboxylesterase
MRRFFGLIALTLAVWLGSQNVALPTDDKETPIRQEPIRLETPTGTLEGTLDLPQGDGPYPVALLIAGSGPTDRDGNQPAMKNDSLKQLGEGLARKGIAVVRFDKRGVGKSRSALTREEDLRFDTFVNDAVAWLKLLRGDPRFGKMFVIGHSEGALIGMLAARQAGADGLVCISGAGRDAPTVLREQLKGKVSEELYQASDRILKSLQAGETVADVPKELMPLYRPSVQPYVISWFKHDPAKIIADLDMPILIVQGTTDIQISVDDAKRLHQAARNARLVVLEGTNHVLKKVSNPLEQQLAYLAPKMPIDPRVVDEIAEFLRKPPPEPGQCCSEPRP